MNSRKQGDLIEKYLTAESTLEEEDKLFASENQHHGIRDWFKYVKQKRRKTPSTLKDSVWAAIQTRKKEKQRFIIRLSGVAASITLFIAVFTYPTVNVQSDFNEKEAILNEALSMFSDEQSVPEKQVVLYEDDMVVIYVATK